MTIAGVFNMTPNDFVEMLSKHGYDSRRIWPPVHTQPRYRKCPYYTHYKEVCI